MSNDSEDLSKLVRELIRKTENAAKSRPPSDQTGSFKNDSPSEAVIAVSRSNRMMDNKSAFGGDPRNPYRELRRYLLDIGIDSRIFSFGTIPIPAAVTEISKTLPMAAVQLGSIDNCFFFEMRKVIESGSYGEKVNALIIMFRVFFEGGQDSSIFWVQAVLNHHHDAILELNTIYSNVIPALMATGWSQPTTGRESTRITYFEKRFTDVTDFKHGFNTMNRMFRSEGMRGNNIEMHA
jgi:hypothetical protein